MRPVPLVPIQEPCRSTLRKSLSLIVVPQMDAPVRLVPWKSTRVKKLLLALIPLTSVAVLKSASVSARQSIWVFRTDAPVQVAVMAFRAGAGSTVGSSCPKGQAAEKLTLVSVAWVKSTAATASEKEASVRFAPVRSISAVGRLMESQFVLLPLMPEKLAPSADLSPQKRLPRTSPAAKLALASRASEKFAVDVMSGAWNVLPRKSIPVKSPHIFAPVRLAPAMGVLVRVALTVAPVRFVPRRSESTTLVLKNWAPARVAVSEKSTLKMPRAVVPVPPLMLKNDAPVKFVPVNDPPLRRLLYMLTLFAVAPSNTASVHAEDVIMAPERLALVNTCRTGPAPGWLSVP